jgi:AcrR family transcriptional regulator
VACAAASWCFSSASRTAGSGGRSQGVTQTGLSDYHAGMARDLNDKLTPRERLLAAADELFYREGVRSVGIDRVIERAGVAKATLYNAFGSKEELVKAYLDSRHEARRRRLAQAMEGIDSPRGKLLVVFDVMDKLFAAPGYRGCAFLNASAESPAGGLVEKVSDEYREWVRSMFEGLAYDAGASDPRQLAQQLVLLYDGATVAAQMDRDRTAALAAKDVATALVDAAIRRGPKRRAR